jgi:hypothetical protein
MTYISTDGCEISPTLCLKEGNSGSTELYTGRTPTQSGSSDKTKSPA